MIRTKDLEEFTRHLVNYDFPKELAGEYFDEIIKRLRELDEIKKEIKSGQVK